MPYKSQLQLGARIGGGQFGDVFEGQDPVHAKVAIKVLKQNTGESTADWAKRSEGLLKEAQRLKAAAHPNVVQVLHIVKDSTNDVLHLVAEYCDGGSVEFDYRNGPLTLQSVRKIITDACRGLEQIHSCGMIHRDIKPGNILRHGNNYKISDFGLVSDNLILGYASGDGYICHLAPEVFPNTVTGIPGITSRKTDVWAMGMTVYRLINGHNFYLHYLTGKDVRHLITNGGFSRSLDWLPHVPDAWRKFVRKAMHDDTAQRFQTALAMVQGLAQLPITPAWICQYTANEITWTLNEGARTVAVVWKIHSPRRHEWYAMRTGGGKRNMSAGGVPGKILTSTAARTELEDFFANWA
ncbi:MAG TPA: serine/threonine-protein kinase [Candidatus Paceibacterota bacterium]|nr:serine/threonine-protein kinase [Candidatus Paceibacterota bacterium]